MKDKAKDLTEYQAATRNLKRVVKQLGLTYRQLAQGLELSESGVKKIFLAKDGSFQRLAQICRYLGISLSELIEDDRTLDVSFTDKQQQEFLKEPMIFRLYWLLVYERRTIADSQEALKIDKVECFRYLRKLDNLRLIKLLPGDRLRLPSIKAVRWTGHGDFIRKIYREWSWSLIDGLEMLTPQKNQIFTLRYVQMTPQTYEEFKAALSSVEEEFTRRSIHEMRTQSSKVSHVRYLVASDQLSFVTGDHLKMRQSQIKESESSS